jgi:hypothetical protein
MNETRFKHGFKINNVILNNGPSVGIANLKQNQCTTDQFGTVTCAKTPLPAAAQAKFTATNGAVGTASQTTGGDTGFGTDSYARGRQWNWRRKSATLRSFCLEALTLRHSGVLFCTDLYHKSTLNYATIT